MKNVQMPPYATREAWQLAAIDSEWFEPTKRMCAKFILNRYNACDVANVIFKKRLELVRMVYRKWDARNGKTLVGGCLTGCWVKDAFCYGESGDLLTPKEMHGDLVGILGDAYILWREVKAYSDVTPRYVNMLQNWAFGLHMILDTFDMLDALLKYDNIADFWDEI